MSCSEASVVGITLWHNKFIPVTPVPGSPPVSETLGKLAPNPLEKPHAAPDFTRLENPRSPSRQTARSKSASRQDSILGIFPGRPAHRRPRFRLFFDRASFHNTSGVQGCRKTIKKSGFAGRNTELKRAMRPHDRSLGRGATFSVTIAGTITNPDNFVPLICDFAAGLVSAIFPPRTAPCPARAGRGTCPCLQRLLFAFACR